MRKPGIKRNSLLKSLIVVSALSIAMFCFIPKVYADPDPDGFSLGDLPQNVADYFNISLFAGQLLCCFMFLLWPTVMIAYAMKRTARSSLLYAVLMVDFTVMGFLIAMTWLPVWILLITVLIVVLGLTGKMRDWISGI